MAARWHVVPKAVRHVLREHVDCDGPRITITEELKPNVWRELKLVLEKLDAVYVIGTSAFELEPDRDGQAVVNDVLKSGRVMRTANAEGFVATPADLAEVILDYYAELSVLAGRKARVLEPSAGTGRFVDAIISKLGADFVELTAVEPDARRARQITTGRHLSVLVEPFEAYADRALRSNREFDLIVMNPPFAVPGRASIWVDHLLAAWKLLTPGGRLVAIVPASALDPDRRGPTRKAHELIRLHGDGNRLDPEAFVESGTSFPTAVVWLDRPPPHAAPPVLRHVAHPSLFRTYTGDEAPVFVGRPYFSRAAAMSMPVQQLRAAWGGPSERILRFRADCAICTRPVWLFDDGANDPRGMLGMSSGGWSLDSEDHGQQGVKVGLCAGCANDETLVERAVAIAPEIGAPQAGQLALGL